MKFDRGKKITAQFNITPLIDIVFLLLIFFMLSAHFMTQPGIKIILPVSDSAKLHKGEDIIIYVTRDNIIYLGDEEITLSGLNDKLRERIKSSKEKNVILRGDKRIDLGFVVQVMDIAKKSGALNIVISTGTRKNDP